MNTITKHNYEAYYLDYLEGNLNDTNQALLFSFLESNPDLKAELDDDVLEYHLNPSIDTLTSFEKEDLKYFDCQKGEICFANVDDFIIAEVENEISANKKDQLNLFIKTHKLETKKALFYATKLKPNLNDSYGNTSDLKKKGVVIPLFIKIASIAAVGLLFFNIFNTNNVDEVYSKRNSNFALKIDNTNYKFELQNTPNSSNLNVTNNKKINSKHKLYSKTDDFATATKKENLKNDSIPRTEKFDPILENQIVLQKPNKITKKELVKIGEVLPSNEIAINQPTSTNKVIDNGIKLVDMYQPITNLTNTYTNLNVSLKKSTANSDYEITAFKIGKFSFERKRKK